MASALMSAPERRPAPSTPRPAGGSVPEEPDIPHVDFANLFDEDAAFGQELFAWWMGPA